MNKTSSITLVAGLIMALTTLGSAAAVVPGGPNNQREPSFSGGPRHDPCENMGHMRRVSQADIDAIDRSQHIALISVCEDLTVPERNNYGALFVNGNVETLRLPIARNSALMSALRAKDYDQHDVVNIRYGANDSIILYVHQRDIR